MYYPRTDAVRERNPNTSIQNRFGQLHIFGDSLAVRFHQSLSSNILCKKMFSWCSRSYNWLYPLQGENEALGKQISDNFDFRPEIILKSIQNALQSSNMRRNDSVLVLNLGLHYAMSINFTTYQELIKNVIRLVKNRGEFGCRAKVIWKTSTAIHKEKEKKRVKAETTWRFFTAQVIN